MKTIDYKVLNSMLMTAADDVIAKKGYLSELDAVIGDGDHGTTISRAMEILKESLEKGPEDDLKALLKNIGWALLGVNGGATGPLLGSLFKGLSDGLEKGASVGAAAVAAMFSKAREAVLKVSGASLGDKTMVDAFVPAVEAIEKSAGGADLIAMFEAAAEAAEKGADSTVDMVARKGRAKNLQEKSRGHRDAGASSMSLIFRGFEKGIKM